jgi:hypothetical protein
MPRKLSEIQALCDAASSLPWDAVVKGNTVKSLVIEGVCHGMKLDGNDARFIAAAREELPRLVKAYQVLSMAVIKTIEGVCETELITNPNLCDGCTVPVPQCKDVRKLATALRSAGITP